MNTVENRIVHMTFDNKKFERDIAVTIASIERLKTTLDFSKMQTNMKSISELTNLKMSINTSAFDQSMGEALGNVRKLQDGMNFGSSHASFQKFSDATKGFSLTSMVGGIEAVSKKFSSLGVIAVTTLATITNRAVIAGLELVKSFSVGPIIDGFREMETNMNSIQTILANTESKGSTLDDVNAALQKLNEYSDKTIYNFSQMAKNIGTFTAAGVDLDTSVGAIKGIANLAAISGSSADQASTAMYQLSQAISTGTLRLIDWTSVTNAGMGGEVFKTALFETGKALGKFGDIPLDTTFAEWEKGGVSFRESLEQDWLTADVLTTTLQAFTGDLTNAQLLALGYTEDQAKEMERLGRLGVASATEVKTLTALLGTLKETVATGWSDTFKLIFGDFNEAKSLFTGLNNSIGGFVSKMSDARNKVLGDWKALGGRSIVLAGIKNAFDALGFVAKQVKTVFKGLFPAITGERLFQLSVDFRQFMANIEQFVQRHGNDLRDIFGGIRAAIEIVIEVVKQVVSTFKELFDAIAGDTGPTDILDFFVDVAEKIKEWKELLVDDGGIAKFFDKIVDIIQDPGKYLDILKDKVFELKGSFVDFFKDIDFGSIDGLVDGFDKIREKIQEVLGSIATKLHLPQGLIDFFSSIGDSVDSNTTNSLAGGFERLTNVLSTLWDIAKKVWDVMTSIGDALKWAWGVFMSFKDIVVDAVVAVIEFIPKLGAAISKGLKSEEFDKILDLMDSLALLLGAKGLSSLSTNGLKFTGDITGGFLPKLGEGIKTGGSLIEALKLNLDALTGTLKAMTTQIKANALLKIAEAVALLTVSVLVLSMIDPEALGKSLGALAVGFGQLIGALALLTVMTTGPMGSAKLAGLTLAMNALATAVLIMAAAVRVLSGLSWEEIGKGLAAVEGIMVIMATNANILSGSSKSLISAGIGMIGIATALVIFAGSMKIFATLSWEEIGKGMASVAGGLILIAGAMNTMPPSTIISGPGLIAVATALVILGGAMKIFSTMSWESIGKGMVAVAGGLLIIAGAMQLMPMTSIFSGPALIAVATALTILGGALKIFATMSWEEIGKAMVVLAGSLVILAGGLEMMSGTLVGAIAVGIAAISFMLLTKALKGFSALSWTDLGRGLLVMGIAMTALAVASLIVQPALPALFLLALALAALGVGFALVGVGAGLLAGAFQIIASAGMAGIEVVMFFLDSILSRIPELAKALSIGVLEFFQQLLDAMPALISSLVNIIGALIDGLIKLTPKFVALAIEWIGALIEIIEEKVPDLVQLGIDLILALLKGIRDNIREIVKIGVDIITNIIKGITEAIPDFIIAVVNLITTLLTSIAEHIDEILAAGLEIIKALALGITENISEIISAAAEIITTFIEEIGESASDIAKAGTDALIEFLGGLTEDTIEIAKAVGELVTAMVNALADEAVAFADAAADIVIDFMNELAEVIRENDEELHDAFVNLATAMVEGLVTALLGPELVKMAKDAAISIVKDAYNAARDWLLPGSPSRRWAELGVLSATGFARGMDDDISAEDSARELASRTTSAFQKALTDLSTPLESMSEFNPTITPVLDLTNVKTQAGELGSILGQSTLQTGVSLDTATSLAAETAQAREDDLVTPESQAPREVKFEQNNYSPESLNTAKIYRQTKNLIVVTKEELEVS